MEWCKWDCPECEETHSDPEHTWGTHCRECGLCVTIIGDSPESLGYYVEVDPPKNIISQTDDSTKCATFVNQTLRGEK